LTRLEGAVALRTRSGDFLRTGLDVPFNQVSRHLIADPLGGLFEIRKGQALGKPFRKHLGRKFLSVLCEAPLKLAVAGESVLAHFLNSSPM
jgi:hypothetical protein